MPLTYADLRRWFLAPYAVWHAGVNEFMLVHVCLYIYKIFRTCVTTNITRGTENIKRVSRPYYKREREGEEVQCGRVCICVDVYVHSYVCLCAVGRPSA